MRRFVCFLGLMAFAGCVFAQVDIVPKPAHLTEQSGHFVLSSNDTVSAPSDARAQWIADFLRVKVKQRTQVALSEAGTGQTGTIALRIDSSIKGRGAYHLKVTSHGITIAAADDRGLFWGVQTLRQLLPVQPTAQVTVPDVTIADAPRYSWRGFMLDTSRHFYPVSFVKKQIDLMSYYKMNVFHWHLTGDQGWRIQIKRYPKLTSVGAWRVNAEGKKVGGFYTQAQIREIVRYARERNVMIVPEIEMPGHSSAAMAAYPKLLCSHKQIQVSIARGVFSRADCIDGWTFNFLHNVLDEVMQLFPSPYIHIGGDEVPADVWSDCKPCEKLASDKGLKTEEQLHGYFVHQIEDYLDKHGKTLVGWDEILQGHLSSNAIVETWHGPDFVKKAAANGNRMILAGAFYLDHSAAPISVRTLQDLFRTNTLGNPELLAHPKTVLGGDAPLWGEFAMPVNGMAFIYPRLLAIAEHMWNPSSDDWNDFKRRVKVQEAWLASQNVRYGPADMDIIRYAASFVPGYHRWRISVRRGFADMRMHYTTDGTDPTAKSPSFRDVLDFYQPQTVRVAPFRNGVQVSDVHVIKVVANKALGDDVTYATKPSLTSTPGFGGWAVPHPSVLTDGILGWAWMDTNFSGKRWAGWRGDNMDVTVDLGKPTDIHSVDAHFLQYMTAGNILLPQSVSLATSADGKHWSQPVVKTIKVEPDATRPQLRDVRFDLGDAVNARYIHIIAVPSKQLPMRSAPMIASDEIVVH
ncbi:MAG TPA: family 20 glycosylhydrolase [Rhodanobacteraceae bacterium]